MGRKHGWAGKHVPLFVACLIIWSISACASSDSLVSRQESVSSPQQVQPRMSQGDFDGALKDNEENLARAPESYSGDEALFYMGLVSAHYENPKKNYAKALSFFTRVVNEFPQSPRAGEATVWIGVLETIGKASQGDIQKRVQPLMHNGYFDGALQESQDILARSPNSSPGDEALFYMGLIYAHYKNAKKDYPKALSFFSRVIKEFPQSPRTEEARMWIGVLEAIEKAKQVDIQIEEKKKELKK
jgi:TolA-binding protein